MSELDKKIDFKFNQNETYILACSFGPDSMALLHYCLSKNITLIVAHVNYHKRAESNQEQADLVAYCKEHKIKLEILDTSGLKVEGNFQNWARNLRYDFFKKVALKYNTKNILVAHQKDDLIESDLFNLIDSMYDDKEE